METSRPVAGSGRPGTSSSTSTTNARLGRGDLRPRGDLGGYGQGRALHLSEDSKLPYGQVLKALVSVIVSKILFCGLTYVLTTLVSVSVTVSVTSTLVNPAAKNQ